MQGATGDTVEVAFADQGYTGQYRCRCVLSIGEGCSLVSEPFRRLARDYERLPGTVAGLHIVAFAVLMFGRLTKMLLAMSA